MQLKLPSQFRRGYHVSALWLNRKILKNDKQMTTKHSITQSNIRCKEKYKLYKSFAEITVTKIPWLCRWLHRIHINLNSRKIRNIILNNTISIVKYKGHSCTICAPLPERFPQITKNKIRLKLPLTCLETFHDRLQYPDNNTNRR